MVLREIVALERISCMWRRSRRTPQDQNSRLLIVGLGASGGWNEKKERNGLLNWERGDQKILRSPGIEPGARQLSRSWQCPILPLNHKRTGCCGSSGVFARANHKNTFSAATTPRRQETLVSCGAEKPSLPVEPSPESIRAVLASRGLPKGPGGKSPYSATFLPPEDSRARQKVSRGSIYS